MSLTRKHYVKVAEILSSQMVASFGNIAGMEAVENISIELAAMFAADNPRFDASTFYSAASVRCYTCHGAKWSHYASEGCSAR